MKPAPAPSMARIVWNRLTLMQHARPGDDCEITPLRMLGGIAFMLGFILLMSALAAAGF